MVSRYHTLAVVLGAPIAMLHCLAEAPATTAHRFDLRNPTRSSSECFQNRRAAGCRAATQSPASIAPNGGSVWAFDPCDPNFSFDTSTLIECS
jgi:hypothetical protein